MKFDILKILEEIRNEIESRKEVFVSYSGKIRNGMGDK